jgi:long-subunit fatty acid transport protein
MRFLSCIVAVFVLAMTGSVHAQVVSATPGTTYLAVVQTSSPGGVCAGAQCINPTIGIPLDNYATSATLASQLAGVNQSIADTNMRLNQKISETNAYMAAVGAMHDAIPDAGDRFALRLNSASVNDVMAFGISGSASLGPGLRASVDFAGTRGETAMSAGLNLSFH